MTDGETHPIVPYATYVRVWGALLLLTAATIGAAQLDFEKLSTSVAILIASIKCSLVLWFFMGLKYDRPILRWMFLVTIVTYAIFLILTYCDYLAR